jgi:hypothetical protein
MNKKRLALIVVATALICVIATTAAFTFFQSPIKNSNSELPQSSSISSLPSSLTPDEISTLLADSFELEIKDMINGYSANAPYTFTRVDSNLYNATVIAQYTAAYANYTSVSETTFLGDLNTNLGYINLGYVYIVRVDNTFYLTIKNYPSPNITVSCTP